MHKRKIGPKKFPPAPISSPTELTPEEAQQLDLEICWCIEELENLMSKKTNDKQKKETETCLNILRNPEAPLIKKRQVMRQQFGDYKKKISDHEEKRKNSKTNNSVNIQSVIPNKNSVFIKKHQKQDNLDCALSDDRKTDVNSSFHFKPSDNTFKFNF